MHLPLKKISIYALRLLVILAGLILTYGLIASILSFLSFDPDKPQCLASKECFVVSNGLHLFIILPTENIEKPDLEAFRVPSHVQYLSFGWGDKAFYLQTPTWNELKFTTAFRALFLKTPAAMHLTFYRNRQSDWIRVPICAAQYDHLYRYVLASFEKDDHGSVIRIEGSGYTVNDTFYEANGHYSCLRTSNNWVNGGLKQAHVKTSVWSPFDFGVLYHLRRQQ